MKRDHSDKPRHGDEPTDWDIDAFLQRLNSRIDAQPVRPSGGIKAYSHRMLRPAIGIGGLLAAAFVAALVITRSRDVLWREIDNGAGQARVASLGGGVQALLAPDTHIGYRTSHNDRQLAINLRGEAKFVIQHDSRRTVTVTAGAAEIVDLGTTFVVRAYPAESRARVIVLSGSVLVSPRRSASRANSKNELVAGTTAEIDSERVRVSSSPDALTDGTAWSEGVLRYNGTAVATVLADLSRWFGVQFTVRDSALLQKHLTATFAIGDRARMLTTLSRVLTVRAELAGPVVTITPAQ